MKKIEPRYRHELKYDISIAEYRELVARLRPVMRRDPHAGENGIYRIQSIYFDNYRDKALREKISGVARREKFRIRWYNNDLSRIQLEKKIKADSLCMKIGAALTEEEYRRILTGDTAWMLSHQDALVRELYVKEKTQLLRPRVQVSYTREPYVYGPGNVRITFDSDIRSSLYHPFSSRMDAAEIDSRMEPGRMILEVKYDDYLPELIALILQTGNVRLSAFSKYGICRRFG